MQFRLSTLLLLFVVLGSSLAVFGGVGIVAFVIVVLLAVSIVRPVWLALLGFLLFLCLLVPAASPARQAARRVQCVNNLKQIALALYNYRDANGCFPPAYVADANGKPMHSWRVLILPYLEEVALYRQYNFNEPWDGPNNRKLLASRPWLYACPSDDIVRAPGQTCTSYVAVVGTNAAWSGSEPRNPNSDFATAIMLVEVAEASIEWTEPKDVSLDALLASSPRAPTVSSKHGIEDGVFTYSSSSVGAHVAFGDGSVQFLPSDLIASDRFSELLTLGGFREEYLSDAKWSHAGRRIHWPRCTAFAVWLTSSGWLLVRAVRSRKKAIVPMAE